MPKTENGFMLFAEHMRHQLEENDGGVRLTREKLVTLAAPYWERLCEDERRCWKEQSKQWRETVAVDVPGVTHKNKKKKKTATNSYLTFLNEQRAQAAKTYFDETDTQRFQQQRKRQRQKLIEHLDWVVPRTLSDQNDVRALAEVKRMEHHLLSVVPYFESEKHQFVPAEVSLLVFSLEAGILEERTWMVALPRGLEISPETQTQMEERSRLVTGIPLVGQATALKGQPFCADYSTLMHRLQKHSKKAKFYYINSQQYNIVQGCMYFMRKTREKELGRSTISVSKDKLLCIEDLASALANFKLGSSMTEGLAAEIQAAFDSPSVQTGCSFHRKTPHLECALTTVKTSWVCLVNALTNIYDLGPLSNQQSLTPIQELCETSAAPIIRKPRTLPPTVMKRKWASSGITNSDAVEQEQQEVKIELGGTNGERLVVLEAIHKVDEAPEVNREKVEYDVTDTKFDQKEMARNCNALSNFRSNLQLPKIRDGRYWLSLTDDDFPYRCSGLGRGWILK